MAARLCFVKGDATAPAERPAIIAHICNDIGGWGKGFVLAISSKWPAPEQAYRAWHVSGDGFALGAMQLVDVEPGLSVANIIGQRGIRSSNGIPPVRYEAIEAGLTKVAAVARKSGASVHMPRIGCGLAGGSWEAVEPLVRTCLIERGVSATVYDFP